AWADNSPELVGNLDRPQLDIATAQVVFTSTTAPPAFQNISLSGRVFTDADGNGTDNGGTEAGVAGQTVTLYRDATNDGTLGAAPAPLVPSTVSAATTGNYSFTDLGAGTYFLQETPPAGSVLTVPANPPGYFSVIAVSGVNVANLNFGNFAVATV